MRLGFIGTGLMGRPMAARLLEAGYGLTVFNRSRDKTRDLASRGATVAESPSEVLREAQVVVLMLSDEAAIRSVLLDAEHAGAVRGCALVQMGTIAPAASRALAREIQGLGGEYLEAPVLGSIPEAREGRLIVMVGGSADQFSRHRDLFRVFGPEPLHIGPVGQAAGLKLALNQLIASLTTAFALSLALVRKEGVAVETFMQILRGSALYAPTFDKKLQRMLDGDYGKPNFPTRHLVKDVSLFLAEASGLGLDTRSLEGVRQTLHSAVERGLADGDYCALYDAVSNAAAQDLPEPSPPAG